MGKKEDVELERIMVKNIFIAGLIIIGLLMAVIFVRTVNYGQQTAGANVIIVPDAPEIDAEQAAINLGEAIRYQTTTLIAGDPRTGQEQPWLDFQDWMQATYPAFHAAARKETVPGGHTLLFTWRGRDPELKPLLLMAHQDVVPVNMGTLNDWDAPPFSGDIQNGYVYGRGTLDNKGALVGLLEALNALAVEDFHPERTILLMLGHDEEVGGSGAAAGIQLLKLRGVSPIMALDEGSMVLKASPLTGRPMGLIGIAEKGYLTLNLTVSAAGGHSSMPRQDSAPVLLARALIALDENQMPLDLSRAPVSTLLRASAGDMSFSTRMALANPWLFGPLIDAQISSSPTANAMVRTTTAPTMLVGSPKENVLAQRASATVNFRIHPNDTEADIIAHVEHLTKDIPGLSITRGRSGIRGFGASPVSPTDNVPYGVLSSIAAEIGNGAPVSPSLVLGATDSRYASAITDNVYRFMPAMLAPEDLGGFHGTNERLTVENVGQLARGYAQIVLAMDQET